jgi:ADP-ribose pyrophosphatase YjhB (NUDIX family)
MIWKPHVTVAAVIERENRFLLVEEHTAQGLRFNQPAGHWESDETLTAGTIREALEESAYDFEPEYLIGIYRWHAPESDVTYLRFAFGGSLADHHPERSLDSGIVRTVWLTINEMRANQALHRSPLVLRCCEDYLAGRRYPLDLLVHYD